MRSLPARPRALNIALLRKLIMLASIAVVLVTVKLLREAGINRNLDLRSVQGVAFNSRQLPRDRRSISVNDLHISSTFARKQSSCMPPSGLMSCAFSHHRPRSLILPDPAPMSRHVTINPHYTCLNHGTRYKTYEKCICREGWYGDTCNIPDSLYGSIELIRLERQHLRLRNSTARNIIYAAPFNHEFDMLEALLHELDDLVEVFIFAESIFTAFGARKPLRLLPRLHRGYLRQFHHKIMYLGINHFPNHGRKDGWISDSYLRSYLGKHGVINIQNTRADDVIIVCDLDEIPSRDSVAFLKFHAGYPEPFGFRLRWSAFGFFWKNSRYTQIPAGCSLGMLWDVYDYDTNLVRDMESALNNTRSELRHYKRTHAVRMWFMGDNNHYAGWHCSGCFDPQGIRIKFKSAQNGDFPRWGGMHEKMDFSYIRSLVREGRWFDGSRVSDTAMSNPETDQFYAPRHLLQNFKKYNNILVNPYRNKTKYYKLSTRRRQ